MSHRCGIHVAIHPECRMQARHECRMQAKRSVVVCISSNAAYRQLLSQHAGRARVQCIGSIPAFATQGRHTSTVCRLDTCAVHSEHCSLCNRQAPCKWRYASATRRWHRSAMHVQHARGIGVPCMCNTHVA
eukprot:1139485-Pelagomonas_calceolata.AAC.6